MISTRIKWIRFFNALFIIVLSFVILCAYIYQYTSHQNPCPLCELQRLAMICVSFGPLLNLRYGLNAMHYSISIIGALFGGFVSLRQICLHICPGFPTFGLPVLGYELYTWAFIVFCSSLFVVGLFLLLYKDGDSKVLSKMNLFEKGASGLIFLITLANIVTIFLICRFSFCPDNM